MRKLGKKSTVDNGTVMAFATPCDCTAVCSAGASTCNCVTEGALYGVSGANERRASNHGGSSVTNGLMKL